MREERRDIYGDGNVQEEIATVMSGNGSASIQSGEETKIKWGGWNGRPQCRGRRIRSLTRYYRKSISSMALSALCFHVHDTQQNHRLEEWSTQ